MLSPFARLWCVAFVVFLAPSPHVFAALPDAPVEQRRTAPVVTFYLENDSFAGADRHYTNGAKLSYLSSDLIAWGLEGWRKTFVDALPFVNRPGGQKNLGLAFGQNMYTPEDTSLKIPDPKDRPYAGWSYLEFNFVSRTQSIMDTLSIQAGVVGPRSYAKETQSQVHEWINDSKPQGWDSQLKNEIGVNVVLERRWRLYARSLYNTVGVDWVPHTGISIGNVQTFANVGSTVRLGLNLPNDFGVELISGGAATNSPLDGLDPRLSSNRRLSVFLFAGCDGRAVARDLFLDGNTWVDSPSVDKERLVGDGYYGVGVVLKKWQLTYTRVSRSREFKDQRHKSYFGSITISRAL
jgi:lipid A 3-O-deacylase